MIGNDFDIPVMYQDLANYSMGPMANPMLMGVAPQVGQGSSYLGGVTMRQPLGQDKLEIMNKKSAEDKSTAKKVLIGLGAVFALGFIPVIAKGIKKSGGVGKYIKDLFSGKKAKGVEETIEKKSWWKRLKEKFSRKKAGSTADIEETVEKKSWWQKLKEKFSRKKQQSVESYDEFTDYADF